MGKKILYYVETNAYDMVISDDGEIRRVLADSSRFAVCDHRDRAAEFLNEIEDDSSWDEYAETVEQLTEGCAILAELERDDL